MKKKHKQCVLHSDWLGSVRWHPPSPLLSLLSLCLHHPRTHPPARARPAAIPRAPRLEETQGGAWRLPAPRSGLHRPNRRGSGQDPSSLSPAGKSSSLFLSPFALTLSLSLYCSHGARPQPSLGRHGSPGRRQHWRRPVAATSPGQRHEWRLWIWRRRLCGWRVHGVDGDVRELITTVRWGRRAGVWIWGWPGTGHFFFIFFKFPSVSGVVLWPPVMEKEH